MNGHTSGRRLLPRPRSAPTALVDERPWGRFEQLALNESVTVKVITVSPGHRLSLQRHAARDEWWQILDEGLVVEVAESSWTPRVGERIWIPRGTNHRVANRGAADARFLEVAYGMFDECDIERLEDDYDRSPTALSGS